MNKKIGQQKDNVINNNAVNQRTNNFRENLNINNNKISIKNVDINFEQVNCFNDNFGVLNRANSTKSDYYYVDEKKNNFLRNFPSKKRAISIEEEGKIENMKKGKITSIPSKINYVKNCFLEKNEFIQTPEKIIPKVTNIRTNLQKDYRNEILKANLIEQEDIETIKSKFEEFHRLNEMINEKVLILNKENLKINKKLQKKFNDKKIKLYELELLNEHYERSKDYCELLKSKKLQELEEKKKVFENKKLLNQKLQKFQDFSEKEKANQREKQEIINGQIIINQSKVNFFGFIILILIIIKKKIFIFKIDLLYLKRVKFNF